MIVKIASAIALALVSAPAIAQAAQQPVALPSPRDDVARGRFPHDKPEMVDGIAAINSFVNANIQYESDQTHYGILDLWVEYPSDSKGDCEDYAITKLGVLEQSNWDVVENTKIVFLYFVSGGIAQGHAVLAVRLPSGDVMYLDSNYQEPMTRQQMEGVGYHFFDWKA